MPVDLSLSVGIANSQAMVTILKALTTGGITQVVPTSTTFENALQEASISVQQIPTAADPGNLPVDAIPGQFYSFTSQPGTLYFQGADNVWRALLAVAVV